ncbi:cytochrome P450 [Coprinopsis cinerea okayama7|uniref:Cytochrome P450 n=1 Tax=Coprinopsis cinerea (strain Okayama-7 / 130 / ATCC MYA-4618 / FGSC 9003) TaxID=240176 RepID=A8NTJ8_COPC7|nr:cytochrome P450 [Coprinopsis cinerea okayama7\|eukprot:XP_001836247.1 cytochrome P450 [Coprinopsis cinerea okayama7\
MEFIAFPLQALALYFVTKLVWAILSRVLLNHPLDVLPGPPSPSYLTGNLKKVFDRSNGIVYHEDILKKYGSAMQIAGPLGMKTLLTSDPKALHHVFVKDQDVHEETDLFLATNSMVFGPSLLSTLGEPHRKQRKMLNPVFSINHMRQMVPIFMEVSTKLGDALSRLTSTGPKEVEVLGWLTRTALELIGQSGFGYSFDPLTEHHEEHPYVTSVKLLTAMLMKTIWVRLFFLPTIHKWNLGGKRLRRFVMDRFSWGASRMFKDIVDTMHKTSLEIYHSKKKALEEGDEVVARQIGQGKDLLSILMRANMEADSDDERLHEDELIAQVTTFTFAAMDTTSSALCRFFYLLAKHQDVQERLRKEIKEAKQQYGEINYDQLTALPYLDAVCRETLRLYPPVPLISREARRDAILPLGMPITRKDGQRIDEIHVPKGTKIWASILGINRMPELWGPDADEWKPERWLSPLPEALRDAKVPGVYSNLMTFIGGGRACIGFKFSQLEMKCVLFVLLDHLRFSLPENKDIKWVMSGIIMPAVDAEKLRPELPLIVERIP